MTSKMKEPRTKPNLFESPDLWKVMGPTLRPGGLSLTRIALAHQPFAPHARVLDIGCGSGATMECLQSEYGLNVRGIDPSQILLEEGLKRNARLSMIRGRAEWLPIADNAMDGVFMECVLSLTEDPERTLQECRRILKPEGALIMSDVYARASVPEPETLPFRSCLGGAMTIRHLHEIIENTGLRLLFWEDHSQVMKQIAAQLVFHFGSMNAFWSAFCAGSDSGACGKTIQDIRPGYYLIIARK